MKKINISEKFVQDSVLDYLECIKNKERIFFWRNNTGGSCFEDNNATRFVRFSIKGAADIICCWKGLFLAIECKSSIGKQSMSQIMFEKELVKSGGIYLVIKSVDDIINFFNNIEHGKTLEKKQIKCTDINYDK
jgi:hypothetical protein